MSILYLIAEDLSLSRQLDLIDMGIDISNPQRIPSYTAWIRPKSKSVYIDIETSGKYIYDKEKNMMYDISGYGRKNRMLGTPEQLLLNLRKSNDNKAKNILRRGLKIPSLDPVVKDEKKIIPPKLNPGKIFHYTWGYDMTHNEYCMVVKDKEKTVDVVKLPTLVHTSNQYNDVGTNVPDRFGLGYARTLPSFQLKKEINSRGEIQLRGKDKGTNYGEIQTWWVWDGKPNVFNYMD